jgi:hypothetical protein
LKEAIDENDRLRESAAQLVEENNKMRNELDEKDNIIRELGEYYQVRYIYINLLKFSFVKKIIWEKLL